MGDENDSDGEVDDNDIQKFNQMVGEEKDKRNRFPKISKVKKNYAIR